MSTKLLVRVTKSILNKSAYCGHIKEEGKYILSDDERASVSTNCAIALAIRDIFPDARIGADRFLPFGDENKVMNLWPTCMTEIHLPWEAQEFIRNFDDKMPDQRRKMEPIEFEIDVPDEVLKHAFPIEQDLKDIFSTHPTLRFI